MEVNPGAGFVDLGTQQLISVPYALDAKHATSSDNATSSADNQWAISGANISSKNSGNVGIGVGSPSAKLEVAGAFTVTSNQSTHAQGAWLEWNKDGIGGRSYLLNQKGLGPGGIIFGEVSSGNAVTERMRISENGYLGIGTTNPGFPLTVSGSVNQLSAGYLYNAFGPGAYPSSNLQISISANQAVSSINFIAQSDARIKKIVTRSSNSGDLELINKLKVTDYKYIDKAVRGDGITKGFIAQEVEKIIPGAVVKSSEFIPSVYALATGLTRAQNGNLIIKLGNAHGVKTGDEIRLYTGKCIDACVVKVVDASTFEVSGVEDNVERLFVYGVKVNDFRAVDYDRIFTTGIGAIQELSKQVQQLNEEKAKMQIQIQKITDTNEALRADINLIKNHLELSSHATDK